MTVKFEDVQKSFSETLTDVARSMPEGHITVRQLLEKVGEHGLLTFCMIMTIPFLTPLPLPGVSTVFGFIIMLISFSIILNRVPWLPGALMKRQIATAQLVPVLERGSNFLARVERLIRPRLLMLTGNAALNRLNGVMLFLAGFLLILPLPVLPLSNFLPGWAVLLLAAGILQRDGYFILAAYILIVITFIYFAVVAVAVILAGGSILQLFREPASFIFLLWR